MTIRKLKVIKKIKFYDNQITYFIIRGYALVFHGFVRNTIDIDILVHDDNFKKDNK